MRNKVWLEREFRPYIGETYNVYSKRPHNEYKDKWHNEVLQEIYERYFSHLDDLYPNTDSYVRIYGVNIADVYTAINSAKEYIFVSEHFQGGRSLAYEFLYKMGADWLKTRMDIGYEVHGSHPEVILKYIEGEGE